MRVNHNISSMKALRHLGDTNRATDKNLERLSSGLRVHSGSDGPADLMISEQMRAKISGLHQAIRNSETSISMTQTAEGALNEVSSILLEMRQISMHAANSGANDAKMMKGDQNEFENLLDTLDRIAQTTQFGTRPLFNGSNSATGEAVGPGLSFISATPKTKEAPTKSGYQIDIQQVASRGFAAGTRGITVQDAQQGMSFVINEGGRVYKSNTKEDVQLNETITQILSNHIYSPDVFSKDVAENNLREAIARHMDEKAREAGLKVNVFIDEIGMLTVRHQHFGSKPSLSVFSDVSGVLGDVANEAKYSKGGKDAAGFIGGTLVMGDGQLLIGPKTTHLEGLVVQYDKELGRRVIDIKDEKGRVVDQKVVTQSNEELVGSSVDGYVHIAQNAVTFQTGANHGDTVAFSLNDIRPDALARNIENNSGYQSLADVDLTSRNGAQDAIMMLDEVIDEVTTLRANLGSFQKNKLETNLKNLRVSSENMTYAESILRDADMAAEMSDFTKNQILLASGTAMSAQANQISKSVLQLLGSVSK